MTRGGGQKVGKLRDVIYERSLRIDALGSYFLTSFIKCSAELVLERIRFFLRDEPMLENLK